MLKMLKLKKKVAFIVVLAIIISSFTSQVFAETKATVVRLGGSGRYETAVRISQEGWKDKSTKYAILATGNDFPDALGATPLSKKYNAPILLTTRDSIPQSTLDELIRLGTQHIFIVGGTGVVSLNLEKQLQDKKFTTERLAGADRYETSVKIAEKLDSNGNECIIVNGNGFQDALSISPIAAKKGIPILLTAQDGLSSSTKAFINNKNISIVTVVGGKDLVSNDISNSFSKRTIIDGSTPYERNIKVIQIFEAELNLNNICLATGRDYPDALAGSAYAASITSPIVLVDDKNIVVTDNGNFITTTTGNYVSDKLGAIKGVYVFGLQGAINDEAVNTLTGVYVNTLSNETDITRLKAYPKIKDSTHSYLPDIETPVDFEVLGRAEAYQIQKSYYLAKKFLEDNKEKYDIKDTEFYTNKRLAYQSEKGLVRLRGIIDGLDHELEFGFINNGSEYALLSINELK